MDVANFEMKDVADATVRPNEMTPLETRLDAIRRHEAQFKSLLSIPKQEPKFFYSPHVRAARYVLRAAYSDLLLYHLDVAQQCSMEHKLWMCIYFKTIRSFRNRLALAVGDRLEQRSTYLGLLKSFLQEGIDHYRTLLIQLQRMYGSLGIRFKGECTVVPPDVTQVAPNELYARRLLPTCYRLLMAMGDLERYLESNNDDREKKTYQKSRKLYLKATRLLPTVDMAFHQLGIIAQLESMPLDAVYYFSKSLLVRGEETIPNVFHRTALENLDRMAMKEMGGGGGGGGEGGGKAATVPHKPPHYSKSSFVAPRNRVEAYKMRNEMSDVFVYAWSVIWMVMRGGACTNSGGGGGGGVEGGEGGEGGMNDGDGVHGVNGGVGVPPPLSMSTLLDVYQYAHNAYNKMLGVFLESSEATLNAIIAGPTRIFPDAVVSAKDDAAWDMMCEPPPPTHPLPSSSSTIVVSNERSPLVDSAFFTMNATLLLTSLLIHAPQRHTTSSSSSSSRDALLPSLLVSRLVFATNVALMKRFEEYYRGEKEDAHVMPTIFTTMSHLVSHDVLLTPSWMGSGIGSKDEATIAATRVMQLACTTSSSHEVNGGSESTHLPSTSPYVNLVALLETHAAKILTSLTDEVSLKASYLKRIFKLSWDLTHTLALDGRPLSDSRHVVLQEEWELASLGILGKSDEEREERIKGYRLSLPLTVDATTRKVGGKRGGGGGGGPAPGVNGASRGGGDGGTSAPLAVSSCGGYVIVGDKEERAARIQRFLSDVASLTQSGQLSRAMQVATDLEAALTRQLGRGEGDKGLVASFASALREYRESIKVLGKLSSAMNVMKEDGMGADEDGGGGGGDGVTTVNAPPPPPMPSITMDASIPFVPPPPPLPTTLMPPMAVAPTTTSHDDAHNLLDSFERVQKRQHLARPDSGAMLNDMNGMPPLAPIPAPPPPPPSLPLAFAPPLPSFSSLPPFSIHRPSSYLDMLDVTGLGGSGGGTGSTTPGGAIMGGGAMPPLSSLLTSHLGASALYPPPPLPPPSYGVNMGGQGGLVAQLEWAANADRDNSSLRQLLDMGGLGGGGAGGMPPPQPLPLPPQQPSTLPSPWTTMQDATNTPWGNQPASNGTKNPFA